MELPTLTFAELSPPPMSADDPGVAIWPGDDLAPEVAATRVGEWCWVRVAGVATFRFPASSPDRSVRCAAEPDSSGDEAVTIDLYYRSVVPLALQVYGLEAMHGTAIGMAAGSAAGIPTGAVALIGSSRVGKTTLTYALSRRGHRVLADDALVIDVGRSGDRVALRPIPFALMIREATAEYFGAEGGGLVSPQGRNGSPVSVESVPLAAVVALDRVARDRAAGAEATLSHLKASDAFRLLIEHSYAFSLHATDRKAAMMAAYFRFANSVPVFSLTYPDGLERLDTAAEALETLAATLA